MPKLSNEEIERARQADLAEYLRMCGYELKKEGKSYRVTDFHGGLIVTGNKWYWQAEQIGGKSVDFLTNVLHVPFRDAVAVLNDSVPTVLISDIDAVAMPVEPVKMPEMANNNRRVIDYLCNTRHIQENLVGYLLYTNKIYQDKMGNCVFTITDDDNCVAGAELHGTGCTRFKSHTKHTGYGFTLHCGRSVTGAMFFESAIDLLSYYQINDDKLTNHDLISMAGVGNDMIIRKYHATYPNRKICICCDNDDAGDKLIKKMRDALDCEIYVHRPKDCHDWNDVLQKRYQQITERKNPQYELLIF